MNFIVNVHVITGWTNHSGVDTVLGFLLLCIKQWLERGFVFLFFFPLLKTIFRTLEAIFVNNLFIMPRAFLKVGCLYKRPDCQFDFLNL